MSVNRLEHVTFRTRSVLRAPLAGQRWATYQAWESLGYLQSPVYEDGAANAKPEVRRSTRYPSNAMLPMDPSYVRATLSQE